MKTVAQLEKELATAKSSEETRLAERQERYREACKVARDARDRRNRLWQKFCTIDGTRDDQGNKIGEGTRGAQIRVIARVQRQIAELDASIAAAHGEGFDARSDSERAADDRKRTRLNGQLEHETTALRELNVEAGNIFSQWLDARREFMELDWAAAQLRVLTPAELKAIQNGFGNGAGELRGSAA